MSHRIAPRGNPVLIRPPRSEPQRAGPCAAGEETVSVEVRPAGPLAVAGRSDDRRDLHKALVPVTGSVTTPCEDVFHHPAVLSRSRAERRCPKPSSISGVPGRAVRRPPTRPSCSFAAPMPTGACGRSLRRGGRCGQRSPVSRSRWSSAGRSSRSASDRWATTRRRGSGSERERSARARASGRRSSICLIFARRSLRERFRTRSPGGSFRTSPPRPTRRRPRAYAGERYVRSRPCWRRPFPRR